LLPLVGAATSRLNMYRVLKKPAEPTKSLSNANLGDILGILNYIEQRIIVEHVVADPTRKARAFGINAIAKYDVTFKNPEGLNDGGVPGFGMTGSFEFGAMTTQNVLEEVARVGDYVGASRLYNQEMYAYHEWYWFTVTGFCPNLPEQCITPFEGCEETEPPMEPATCKPKGCAGKAEGAKEGAKCPADKLAGHDFLKDDVLKRSCCLHYKDKQEVVRGGQCNAKSSPTGEHGCVFQVSPLTDANYVLLDDVVGITKLRCKTNEDGVVRDCKDWYDWRTNCDDPDGKYKRKFTCTGACHGVCNAFCLTAENVEIEKTEECIEYDLHPFCQDNAPDHCGSEKCQALKPEERELGLPYWRGRCDAASNQRRAEGFAVLFLGDAVRGKHSLLDKSVFESNPDCGDQMFCTANGNGGPYCTRTFAGLCSQCYIPGTEPSYGEAAAHTSVCPYSVFTEPGMHPHDETTCKSDKPEDLCCLYGIPGQKCGTGGNDLSGYMLAASLQDTEKMENFLRIYAAEVLGAVVADEERFRQIAYSAWSAQPPIRPSPVPWKEQLENVWHQLEEKLSTDPSLEQTTKTTTTATTSTATTSTATRTTATATTSTVTATDEPPAGNGNLVKVFGLVVLLVAAVGGFLFLAYHRCQRPAPVPQARESRPSDANAMELSRM